MRFIGIVLAFAGWLIPIAALSFTPSASARFAAAVLGIIVSLVGILGILNKAHLERAIWKKG